MKNLEEFTPEGRSFYEQIREVAQVALRNGIDFSEVESSLGSVRGEMLIGGANLFLEEEGK